MSVTAPMIEVSGLDEPMVVFGPWTVTNMKDTRLAELLKQALHVEEQLEEAREAETKPAAETEKQTAAEGKLAVVRRERARAKSDKELQVALVNVKAWREKKH